MSKTMPPDEILEVLEAFERSSGLRVCVKFLQASPPLETRMAGVVRRFGLHRSDFCRGVKETRNEKCRVCDLREVPNRCAREKRIFTHTCHAGAREIIVPVLVGGVLVAVVFAGQFRSGPSGPPVLARLSAERRRHATACARMLGSYLTECLRDSGTTYYSARHDAIYNFLTAGLSRNPGLGDLAEHLGLSETRTAHVVKEQTGRSFVKIRDELRLERAKSLLAGMLFKVSQVAGECGFSSPEYFHRFFRARTGLTPNQFRRRVLSEA